MNLAKTLPERLQLLGLRAENVKNLRLIDIQPRHHIVQIGGPNGSGKSSLLDSLEYLLTGKTSIPSEPVRRGEKEAKIVGKFGVDGKVLIVVTREWWWGIPEGQTEPELLTRLKLQTDKGGDYESPQRVLASLWSKLALDPVRFAEQMTPREQLEVIRPLVHIAVDIPSLDKETDELFVTRTGVHRERDELEAQVAAYTIGPEWPRVKLDVSAVLSEMTVAAEKNRELEKQSGYRMQDMQKIASRRASVEDMKARAVELRRQATVLAANAEAEEQSIVQAEQEFAALPRLGEPVDLAVYRDKVENANEHNDKVRQFEEWSRLEQKFSAKEAEHESLTERIEANRAKRQRAIADAKFPVAGLSFGTDEVLFNDLPLNQASSSERHRIAAAVVMAQQPQLRLILVKDASLLDSKSLELYRELAEREDYQVWMEIVRERDAEGNPPSVGVYIENGAVIAADDSVTALL